MAYLIGTDEAGYGPNLGPLVVSASVWRVRSLDQTDLYGLLRNAVLKPGEARPSDAPIHERLQIGDSKALYKPGQGLAGLEQGVLSVLAAADCRPRTWKAIWELLAGNDAEHLGGIPWYRDFDADLPVDCREDLIYENSKRLLTACESEQCFPIRIMSRVICPDIFNAFCVQYGNKAATLSHVTLQLVAQLLQNLPADEPVYVLCDKHGGRNKYGPILNEVFPDTLAIVGQENRQESQYQLGNGSNRREFTFRAKADADFLPSALASMVSKYLRELAMWAFNHYWTERIEDLKPTAGYPVDAKRFKADIATVQTSLGIADHVLWRNR